MIVATLQDDIIQDPSKLLKLSEVMLVFEPSSFEPEEFFKGSGQGQEPSLNRGGKKCVEEVVAVCCCEIHVVGLLRLPARFDDSIHFNSLKFSQEKWWSL
jgi:hypothetical protein